MLWPSCIMRSLARADREESSGVELSCFVEMGHLTPFLGSDPQNWNSAQHHYLHNQLNKEKTFKEDNLKYNTRRGRHIINVRSFCDGERQGGEMRCVAKLDNDDIFGISLIFTCFLDLYINHHKHLDYTLWRFSNIPTPYDLVAAWGHFPCWRRPQTCHLQRLAQSLCDVQLSSDFNMLETLTHRVNWP